MPYNFTYYVHHHGSGHVLRAICIVKALRVPVTLLGSNLAKYRDLIPDDIEWIDLPMDTDSAEDTQFAVRELPHLHYAPLNCSGLRKRNELLVKHFSCHANTILIVDVSAEVTQLAALCGVPTVVIRQHGRRTDLAHRIAYECAEKIIAPYPKSWTDPNEEGLYDMKTWYTGVFSRYTNHIVPQEQPQRGPARNIGVIIGSGGTNLDASFISRLRVQLASTDHIHIIGQYDGSRKAGITIYGHLSDPADVLLRCDVVITNSGHNAVMELGDLKRRMICVPAPRPFDEQLIKAQHLQSQNLAVVVEQSMLHSSNWLELIDEALALDISGWDDIKDPDVYEKIAGELLLLHDQIFDTK